MVWNFGQRGFILLELLITILLLQIGVLGISELFLNTSQSCFNLQTSLQALELLRGEMEIIETGEFITLHSYAKDLANDLEFSLQVADKDINADGVIEYKILAGEVSWVDIRSRERCYRLVTIRHHP